ncbi:hypothetical protein PSY27_23760, partial [Shigella flexneri]|nr:hypothetical protein [Shigella flexneri]
PGGGSVPGAISPSWCRPRSPAATGIYSLASAEYLGQYHRRGVDNAPGTLPKLMNKSLWRQSTWGIINTTTMILPQV